MNIDVTTVKCPVCEQPYNVYAFMEGNQSACPDCVRKANEKEKKQ